MTAVGGPYREHPAILLRNFFLAMQVPLMLTITGSVVIEGDLNWVPYAMLFAAAFVYVLIRWYFRTLEIGEHGVIVRFQFILRKFSALAYTRVASVHHNRGIFDRLFRTVTVQLNLNSAVNAAPAEVSFTFGQARAREVRDLVYARSFRGTAGDDEDQDHPPLIRFKFRQVLAHAILGQSTFQLLIMLALIGVTARAIFADWYLETEGFFTNYAVKVLLTYMIIPVLFKAVQFYGFHLYRDGDAICLQHGLIVHYRTEFAVTKISAIHMRQPWLARLVHRSYLEAEVVGIRTYGREFSPTLCLLQKNKQTDALLHELLPEYRQDVPEIKKGRAAESAMLAKAGIVVAIIVIFAVWIYSDLFPRSGIHENGDPLLTLVRLTPLFSAAVIGLYLFRRAYRRYYFQNIGLGDEQLVMRNGVTDREWVAIPYDRITRVDINGDLIALLFGVCRLSVYILGNSGPKRIISGFFPRALLQQVPDIIKARIADGRYDIRENMI